MYTQSRIVYVRPELNRIAQYVPGESLETFSARTNIPIKDVIKLNSNESPYGPAPAVIKALGNYSNYNNYPDTEATALRAALATYTGLGSPDIVLSHGSNELINQLWHSVLLPGEHVT